MNQGFKLRYDQMRDGDPMGTRPENTPTVETGASDSAGNVRNLCLCWLDGRRLFLNYAYLVTGEFTPGDETNIIKLGFTSHNVTLQGYGLDVLFSELLGHSPRFIHQVDPRYEKIEVSERETVVAIGVEEN